MNREMRQLGKRDKAGTEENETGRDKFKTGTAER